jgi:hypothetical protein
MINTTPSLIGFSAANPVPKTKTRLIKRTPIPIIHLPLIAPSFYRDFSPNMDLFKKD